MIVSVFDTSRNRHMSCARTPAHTDDRPDCRRNRPHEHPYPARRGRAMMAQRTQGLSRFSEKPPAKIRCASITADKFSEKLAGHFRSVDGGKTNQAVGTVLFDALSGLDATSQARLLHILPNGDSVSGAAAITFRFPAFRSCLAACPASSWVFRN